MNVFFVCIFLIGILCLNLYKKSKDVNEMAYFSLEPNGTTSSSQSFKMYPNTSYHTRSGKTVQSCSPHLSQASSSVPRVENALDLPIGLASIQPLATLEYGRDWVGCVGHLDAL